MSEWRLPVRGFRRAGIAASVALLGATLSPAMAGGSTTTVEVTSQGMLKAVSAVGGDNDLQITQPLVELGTKRFYLVTESGDSGSLVASGPGCKAVTPVQVRCASSKITHGYQIRTGDGDDRIDLSDPHVKLDGKVDGGDDDDVILPGPGNDTVIGGAGDDLVTYHWRATGVTVTIDGSANDGQSGEADNVSTDIENVEGTNSDDRLTGSTAANTLTGLGGADTIIGNYGDDLLNGGEGNDVIFGSGGHDQIKGGPGNDDLQGHGGNDTIYGEGGRDKLNGGSGNDKLIGGADQDFVMAIGLGVDNVTGGPQWDSLWLDTDDVLTDMTVDENTRGYVHLVAGYHSIAGVYSPGLDAKGEDLPDPTEQPGDASAALVDYGSQPLWSPSGPKEADIDQGALGDCFFLTRLGTLAMTNPDYIRNSVAPLGDGSYAVRFWVHVSGNLYTPEFVRVDGDLWSLNGRPIYAGRQVTNVWPAIIEKAYAVARRDKMSYDSIAGGNGPELAEIATDGPEYDIDNGYLPPSVIRLWEEEGEPAGYVADYVHDQNKKLMNWIDARRDEGKAVGTGSVAATSNTLPLTADNYRRGQHVFMVIGVNRNAQGEPVSVAIRNPWGADTPGGPVITISDPARIWYFLGRAYVYYPLKGSLFGTATSS